MKTDCVCGKPGCPECAELAAVAALVQAEFDRTLRDARVPSPFVVWQRAQVRAREEAARAAARPILFSQALAVAALLGLLVSMAGRLTLSALSWPVIAPLSADFPVLPIALAAGCWLLLAPLALYLSLSRD